MMILITTNFSTEQIKFHGCKCVTRFFFFFFFAWIYSNFRTRIWHWNLSPWFQIYEKICDTRRVFLYDIVRKGSFIAVDACHWTLCVTVSVIDSCLCRVGVSKFGGERDRGIVCSLSARIQCTWDSLLTGACRMCIRCSLSARKFYATSGISPFYYELQERSVYAR